MSLHKLAVLTVAVLAIGGVVPARAQTARPPAKPSAPATRPAAPPARPSPSAKWTGRASVNFGVQPSSISFTDSRSFDLDLETGTAVTSYTVPKGTLFDAGFAMRVMGNLGVGVAVSSFSSKQDANVALSVPHPFFFNRPRTTAGILAAAERKEMIVHVQGVYVINPGGTVDVAVSGGPSFFNVSQDLVTDPFYSEAYPFDTITFVRADKATVSKSGIGFHAGVDVGVRLTQLIGVGGMVRYTKATVEFPLDNATGGTVTSDAGGLQAGGGIRLYF